MYIQCSKKNEIAFSFNVNDNNILHVDIILDFPMTYRNASVLCQSEYRHKTVNMVVFFVKKE